MGYRYFRYEGDASVADDYADKLIFVNRIPQVIKGNDLDLECSIEVHDMTTLSEIAENTAKVRANCDRILQVIGPNPVYEPADG